MLYLRFIVTNLEIFTMTFKMLPPGKKKKHPEITGAKGAYHATEQTLIKKAGRPACEIDEVEVFEMASWDCTVDEIAAHFKCTATTIYERFSETLRLGKEAGKTKLRQHLMRKSYDGGAGEMAGLIWLSKQRLGYKENHDDHHGEVTINIQVIDAP